MTKLGNAKVLGGVGAILILIGGFVTQFLSLIGFIMVLIAVKYISDEVKDKSIFSNFLLFVVLNIIAIIVLAATVFVVLSGVAGFSFFTTGEISDPTAFMDEFEDLLAICILGFIIYYVINIIAALFLKKSFNSITKHTRVDMFKTTGTVYFIGAILIIIVFGFIIIWIATILMIIAFFSLPETVPPAGAAPGQTGRVCPNCGRPIPMDAQVCPYCGKDFRPQ
jgi:uncharacterized membrane protein